MDTPLSESRFADMLEGWVDEEREVHDEHDLHANPNSQEHEDDEEHDHGGHDDDHDEHDNDQISASQENLDDNDGVCYFSYSNEGMRVKVIFQRKSIQM